MCVALSDWIGVCLCVADPLLAAVDVSYVHLLLAEPTQCKLSLTLVFVVCCLLFVCMCWCSDLERDYVHRPALANALRGFYVKFPMFSNVARLAHRSVLLSTAQHSTAQHSAAQHSAAQRSAAQRSTAQHNTAQHSTAQHNTAQRSAAQHSTAQHTSSHCLVLCCVVLC